jgi:hypothetical protein
VSVQHEDDHESEESTKTEGCRFNGSGVQWMAVPRFFTRPEVGAFWTMNPSPELRLYMVLLAKFNDAGESTVTLDNETIMRAAVLNKNYFNSARNSLVESLLVKAKRDGMSRYRYTLLKQDGKTLDDMSEDTWGNQYPAD